MNNTLFIVGIVLLIVGVIGGVQYNSKNVGCNSTMGQIGQMLSTQNTQNCTTYESLMYVSFVLALVGLVLLIVGATSEKK
jgi:uncharacterized membrane protein YeaQ/YmgE (transglycosylase-associated protein family)